MLPESTQEDVSRRRLKVTLKKIIPNHSLRGLLLPVVRCEIPTTTFNPHEHRHHHHHHREKSSPNTVTPHMAPITIIFTSPPAAIFHSSRLSTMHDRIIHHGFSQSAQHTLVFGTDFGRTCAGRGWGGEDLTLLIPFFEILTLIRLNSSTWLLHSPLHPGDG